MSEKQYEKIHTVIRYYIKDIDTMLDNGTISQAEYDMMIDTIITIVETDVINDLLLTDKRGEK